MTLSSEQIVLSLKNELPKSKKLLKTLQCVVDEERKDDKQEKCTRFVIQLVRQDQEQGDRG